MLRLFTLVGPTFGFKNFVNLINRDASFFCELAASRETITKKIFFSFSHNPDKSRRKFFFATWRLREKLSQTIFISFSHNLEGSGRKAFLRLRGFARNYNKLSSFLSLAKTLRRKPVCRQVKNRFAPFVLNSRNWNTD